MVGEALRAVSAYTGNGSKQTQNCVALAFDANAHLLSTQFETLTISRMSGIAQRNVGTLISATNG
jgi:hypothetical protein